MNGNITKAKSSEVSHILYKITQFMVFFYFTTQIAHSEQLVVINS
jgi:hypothetical protein